MAKSPTSVIGVDLGRHSLKSVALQRKGANRFVLSHYAVRKMERQPETPEDLAAELTLLFKEMGGVAKTCAVAVSSKDALFRIIEQPATPTVMLREAMRLNGMTWLNQDVRDFVLDCEVVVPADPAVEGAQGRYLVCGLPRAGLTQVDEAFQTYRKGSVHNVQLAPVCAFNAFEFAHPEIFNDHPFVLVDIGHTSSTVTVGVKRELMLVRSIEFGGNTLLETLSGHGARTVGETQRLLEQNDPEVIDAARLCLTALTREIASSIGFFEGRREETISKVFISGASARSKALLQVLSSELHIPCEAWDPFATCEISLAANRKATLAEDFVSLNVACGAAAEALKGN